MLAAVRRSTRLVGAVAASCAAAATLRISASSSYDRSSFVCGLFVTVLYCVLIFFIPLCFTSVCVSLYFIRVCFT